MFLYIFTPHAFSLFTFLHSDGLHTDTCGLSLWQCKNGKLPDSKPCKNQWQNQGRTANTVCCPTCVGPFLYFDELCVSRMATLLYIRLLSRATPTLSTCCSNTVPQPTSWPWSVHPHQNETLITWCLLLLMPYFCCVTGQNGNTALSIACRLGYISVVDTLRAVTDESLAAMVRHWLSFNDSYLSQY